MPIYNKNQNNALLIYTENVFRIRMRIRCIFHRLISILLYAVIASVSAYANISIGTLKVLSYDAERLCPVQGTEGSSANLFTPSKNRDIGLSVYGHFSFGSRLIRFMLQPEIIITLNNGINTQPGIGFKNGMISMQTSFNSKFSGAVIDIPLLFGGDLALPYVTISLFKGPYLSIPLYGVIEKGFDIRSLQLYYLTGGITTGLRCTIRMVTGNLVFDMRYNKDLPITQISRIPQELLPITERKNICVSIGYQYHFK